VVSQIVCNGTERAIGIGEKPDLDLDRQMLSAGHIGDKDSSPIRRPGIAQNNFVGGRDKRFEAPAREIKELNLAERFAVRSQCRNRHAFAIGGPGEFCGRTAVDGFDIKHFLVPAVGVGFQQSPLVLLGVVVTGIHDTIAVR